MPTVLHVATSAPVQGSLRQFVDVICREHGAVLLGVLNVTPDSFYDGARFLDSDSAKQQVDHLLNDGADVIDIGAESTRPGAAAVSPEEQLARALPALEYALKRGATVSIDTTSPLVARRAVELGARIINDVSCLADPELARIAAEHDAALLVMHSRGSMTNMPGFGHYPDDGYEDVVSEVKREWLAVRKTATAEGLAPEQMWFDPGLGFHKSASQSAELLRRLEDFSELDSVICVGASRKSFIGALDDTPPEARLGGSIAAGLRAVAGGARVLRVHDVQPMKQALLAARAFAAPSESAPPTRRNLDSDWRVQHDA